MSTFVILAAGRGSRVGGSIHKALLPLQGVAVLTHLIRLAPEGSKIIVCTGYNAEHIREYLRLTGEDVETVHVQDWDGPEGGPGWSLLRAYPHVEGDMYFTTCDTLWDLSPELWEYRESWLGVAPLPSGTPPARWCRVMENGVIVDKQPNPVGGAVHTGMGMIAADDLTTFFYGIEEGSSVQGETQMSAGFKALPALAQQRLPGWLDVGDQDAYSRAVRLRDGFDWSKPKEATYLLGDRVVKYWPDSTTAVNRMTSRADLLGKNVVPEIFGVSEHMLSMERVEAEPAYDTLPVRRILSWADEDLWGPIVSIDQAKFSAMCRRFYIDKTNERVELLRPELRGPAADAVSRVSWDEFIERAQPSRIHGDFMLGNILIRPDGSPVAVDWRPDFAGELFVGDIRYDLAKLLSGTYVHWDRARHGDFRTIDLVQERRQIREYAFGVDVRPNDLEILAGLIFVNSAPLHNEPFDEILVWHGTRLLEDFTS